MAHLAVQRGTSIDRHARAEFVVGTGRHVVPGSNNIPILTVKVVDYAGKDPHEAAAEVWSDWQRRYPGALIQIVHGDRWQALT